MSRTSGWIRKDIPQNDSEIFSMWEKIKTLRERGFNFQFEWDEWSCWAIFYIFDDIEIIEETTNDPVLAITTAADRALKELVK